VDTVAPDCETVHRGGAGADKPDSKVRRGGRCVVPKLRGLTAKKARTKLRKAGCKTKLRRAASRRVKRGRVIRQSKRASKRLKRGATVTVTVSRGRR
jgi:beta-lactam-binding protein with PASTA domain